MTIEQAKHELLDKEVFRNIRVKSKSITVIDMEHIRIGDNNIIELDKKLFSRLMIASGLKPTLLKSLFDAYKDNREILRILMERFKNRSKDANIILVYNVASNKLINIVPESKIITSYASYLDLLERQLSTKGNTLRNLDLNYSTGQVQATLYNNKDFDILGLKDEFFKGGFSFDYNLEQLSANYFMQRLVCANGMVTTTKLGSLHVHKPSDIGSFVYETRDKAWHGANVTAIKEKSVSAMDTRASIAEVMKAYNTLKSTVPADKFDLISSTLTGSKLLKEMPQAYFLSNDNHKYLKSPINKYQLVNEITAVSSYFENSERVSLEPYANRGIQKLGGEVLFAGNDLPTTKLVQFYN